VRSEAQPSEVGMLEVFDSRFSHSPKSGGHTRSHSEHGS